MFKSAFIFIFATWTASLAAASVDLSSGAFFHSWIDYEGKNLDLNVKLERTYNSRSNHIGWFGFGWCSDFETSLTTEGQSISVNHCGDGGIITYRKIGSEYHSSKLSDGVIRKFGSTFTRTYADATVETFSQNGQLSEIRKKADYISLKYDKKGFLKGLNDSGGKSVHVETNSDGNILNIYFSYKDTDGALKKDSVAKYTYSNGNLVSAINSWGNTYTYDYDKDHNLTKATWPNNVHLKISYNSNDWVSAISGDKICNENYDYKVVSSNTPVEYRIKTTKSCADGITAEKMYTHLFSPGNKRLMSSSLSEDEVQQEFKYDDRGNVIQIIEFHPRKTAIEKVVTTIDRDKKGNIIKIVNPFEVRQYEYRPGAAHDLVASFVLNSLSKGKVIESLKFTFSYDDSDNLIVLKKPNGTSLAFSYTDGKIDKITAKDYSVDMIYSSEDVVTGVKFNGKILPLDIYDKSSSDKEIAAVELYSDYIRAMQMINPSL